MPPVSYQTLRRGHKQQETLAKTLHREAQVPEGPCDLEAIKQFQTYLTSYQIKVFQLGPPHMVIYAGPPVDTNKQILLIQDGTHFDGCTSYGAFLNKFYFCHECNRGYEHESFEQHRCDKKYCTSCYSRDCEDFLEAKRSLPEGQSPTPTTHCTLCNRNFHGQNCLTKHLQRGNSQSTCEKIKTCSDCCKTYEIEFNKKGHVKGRKHKCGWSKCDICEKHVELTEHLCYIQPIGEDEDLPKCKRVLPSEVGERTVVDD